MSEKTIKFEDFARAYFDTHCRQDEGFVWAELDECGREFWRMKAGRMWECVDGKPLALVPRGGIDPVLRQKQRRALRAAGLLK